MVAQQVFLPNGQSYTVTPVFGGYAFKSNNLDLHHSAIPPGWTVILRTEDEVEDVDENPDNMDPPDGQLPPIPAGKQTIVRRFVQPTLNHDSLFISSVSMPASIDFRSPTSPTRHIAMMVWASLYWYFHKDPPSLCIATEATARIPDAGKPRGDWRIKIKRDGILKGKNTLQKLERMGIIASEDSCVGIDTDSRMPSGWSEMFVSRKMFWQIDGRIFLFTLAPVSHSPFPTASPHPSRPSSPDRAAAATSQTAERPSPHRPKSVDYVTTSGILAEAMSTGVASPGGPFNTASHLPTYYPPTPTQYTFTNGVRHPIRPKPPRQGETFYTRYIPSLSQWLSFRVPSLSPKPVPYFSPTNYSTLSSQVGANASLGLATLPTFDRFEALPDVEILHKWMNEPRVNAAWGAAGPISTQQTLLETALSSNHSFPVFGCIDGKPFGYFEIYWVKEDRLGSLIGGNVDNHTRGLHVAVGEQDFRGPHRVKVWLDALVHYCWLADNRTESVMLEPRVDNTKFIGYLQQSGFYKQGEVTSPYKQSALMRIDRDGWEAPSL